MAANIINRERFADLTVDKFNAVAPYPWINFDGFLVPEQFAELHKNFPSLDLFEHHQEMPRKNGQRPLVYITCKKNGRSCTGLLRIMVMDLSRAVCAVSIRQL